MNNVERYDEWHRRRSETEAAIAELSHPWHLTVARLLPDLNGRRVLEVGCGRGDFAIWLANRYSGAEVVGIDFSEGAIEVAKRRAIASGSRAVFQVDDSQALSFEDNSFDYVISCECLEHVPRPERMAREIQRVLHPGAEFILTTENYFNGMILLWLKTWITGAPFDSGSGVQPHENFFLFWRVKKILEKSGLQVDRMESNHYQWLLLPRTNPMKLVTFDFQRPLLRKVFTPFGRHFTFCGRRPG